MKKSILTISTVLFFAAYANISISIAQDVKTSLFKYDEMSDYYEDLLKRVCSNGKYGFIDFEGNEVIPLKYEEAFNFRNGLAPVKLNGKWGYIDNTGKEITPFKYDEACNFPEDFDVAAVIIGGKYGFVDKAGNEITPIKYNVHARLYETELVGRKGTVLSFNEKYEDFQSIMIRDLGPNHPMINKETNKAYHPRYVDLQTDHTFIEGLAAVSVDCEECIRDIDRQNALRLGQVIRIPERWGFIDVTGKEIIPTVYEKVGSFGECSKRQHCWVVYASYPSTGGKVFLDINGVEYPAGLGLNTKADDNVYEKALRDANKAMRELEKSSERKPSQLGSGTY